MSNDQLKSKLREFFDRQPDQSEVKKKLFLKFMLKKKIKIFRFRKPIKTQKFSRFSIPNSSRISTVLTGIHGNF